MDDNEKSITEYRDILLERRAEMIAKIKKEKRKQIWQPLLVAVIWIPAYSLQFYALDYGWAIASVALSMINASGMWRTCEGRINFLRGYKRDYSAMWLDAEKQLHRYRQIKDNYE